VLFALQRTQKDETHSKRRVVSAGSTADLEYMLPFGDQGLTKPFWSSTDSAFPCCWGTLAEAFSKLADSIYFRSPDNSTLFVNLFESSTVVWDGIKLEQRSVFPLDLNHTTTLTVLNAGSGSGSDRNSNSGGGGDGNRTIAIRVPWWADGTNNVTVNGEAVPPARLSPSSYLLLSRVWQAGDRVEIHYPMSLRFESIDDSRPLYKVRRKTPLFAPFIYKMHRFTKTGSGQA
jgi:DUF1680 family protein